MAWYLWHGGDVLVFLWHLRCRVDAEFQLCFLAVVDRESFHQQGGEARSSPSTKWVEDEKALMEELSDFTEYILPSIWDFTALRLNKIPEKMRKNWGTLWFLASQDAIEVMWVTYWLTEWVIVRIDLTDVTLVSDDTYRRLYWCDPDDPDESYLVMKVI